MGKLDKHPVCGTKFSTLSVRKPGIARSGDHTLAEDAYR